MNAENELAPGSRSLTRWDLNLHPVLRALLGAALGTVPFLLTVFMLPGHRSPYLIAYPVVILSAWLLGPAGSVACAAVCGLLVEHYIFGTHQVALGPTSANGFYRESVFLGGSVLAGVLTRTAALKQQRTDRARLEEQIALAAARQTLAEERERAAELARENEGRVQLALEGANVGLWEWDIASNTSKWSSGFYRLHGLDEAKTGSYDLWRVAVHPADIGRVEAELQRSLDEHIPFAADYRVVLPENELRWLTCQANVICENGKPVRMVGFAGDVTRRKLADQALLESEKLAVAGRLSASIAHEVVNPLEAAMNLIYLASTAEDAAERQGFLDDSVQQLLRVAQITKQTLKFSRSANTVATVTGAELLQNVLDLLRPKLNLAKIEFSVDVRSDAEFVCASGEIQQVLTNILNNAAEAGATSIVARIARSHRWAQSQEKGIRLTVADNGSGMSPDVLRRLREPFFTTKEGTGTGLGMWIVSELVRRHHGILSVRSRAGRGTVMSIFIPFGLDPAELETHG